MQTSMAINNGSRLSVVKMSPQIRNSVLKAKQKFNNFKKICCYSLKGSRPVFIYFQNTSIAAATAVRLDDEQRFNFGCLAIQTKFDSKAMAAPKKSRNSRFL